MITQSLRKAIEAAAAKRRSQRIEKTCPVCQVVFWVRPSMTRQVCCSFSCARLYAWGRPDYRAAMIRSFQGRPSSRRGKRFSRESILRARNAHAFHRGGDKTLRKNGYFYVYSPDHPRAICGRVPEQVLIAEKAIGRFLRLGEIVHHINGVKTDNRNANLLVCSESYHKSLHAKMRRLGKLPPIPGIETYDEPSTMNTR